MECVLIDKYGTEYGVRGLTLADEAALRAFGKGLSEATTENFYPHGYSAAALAVILQRAETGVDVALGLFRDGALVGYGSLWDVHTPSPILCLGLADAHQQRGLGPQLLDMLVGRATKAGCTGVDLTCMPLNAPAYQLYLSRGFVEYGLVQNCFGEGEVDEERGMLLALQPGAQPAPLHVPPSLR